MQADLSTSYTQVRRAYEWGRFRTSVQRALFLVVPVAAVALLVTGRSVLAWLPVTMTVWLIAHWRGGPLLRGAFFGLLGGAVTYALPMTILRPCCTPEAMAKGMAGMAGMDCCTRPGACLGAGALVGFALAAFVPMGSARWRTAGGMALGIASVAVLRCSTLFIGEAVGLVGGVLAGIMAATMARLVLGPRAVPQDRGPRV